MRRNTLLVLFIWAMAALIFAVAMPAAARRDDIHPQGIHLVLVLLALLFFLEFSDPCLLEIDHYKIEGIQRI